MEYCELATTVIKSEDKVTLLATDKRLNKHVVESLPSRRLGKLLIKQGKFSINKSFIKSNANSMLSA